MMWRTLTAFARRCAALGARTALVVLGVTATACSPSGPKTGSQTNWLRSCQADSDCGDLRCICGTCTRGCGDVSNCNDLSDATCVADDDPGAIALCGGIRPASYGICVPRCSSEDCPDGSSCVAGVCTPLPEPRAQVLVDASQRFQTLIGIGAGLGYVVDEIAQHPLKAELFDAMFSQSGLTMLRVRNRFGLQNEGGLGTTGEIIAAATERLGQAPLVLLTSLGPPGALKQNGSNWCEGNPDTCTLARLDDGSFDYAGLATHLRASLEAYSAAGVEADYLSLQNNPNWVPPTGDANKACKFLPTEGTETVTTDAGDIEVEYAGYAQALAALQSELQGLSSAPEIIGPETTNFTQVDRYLPELDPADLGALAHHFYGTDPTDPDVEGLAALGSLGEQLDLPLFQSEMYGDPLSTAVFLHAALAVEGAAVYIQNNFVASASDKEPGGLINLTASDFSIGDSYHVIHQYSQHIAPGWVRVAADASMASVLASAWISPEDDALVVVLTNPELDGQAVQIEGTPSGASTSVTRTTLNGVERSAELGALPAEGIVSLPGHSVVTVTFQE